MLLEELARELVPVTSELLGGRTLNVMSPEGIIIASTEKERIGTFHQGALEAVQTGRTVSITHEQLPLYPGAKEGCNMPLRLNGEIIGAVGIYGNPEEIAYLARLWEAYAAKAYQLEMMTNPQMEDAKIRGRIMRNLLYPQEGSISDAASWMARRGIRLQPPFRIMVAATAGAEPLTRSRSQELLRLLSGRLDLSSVLWSTDDDRLVFLLGSPQLLADALLDGSLKPEGYRFYMSGECSDLYALQRAYRRACLLCDLDLRVPMDASQPAVHAVCMLAETAEQEEPILQALCDRALKTLRREEWDALLKTAALYYDEQRSVSRAAQRLYIHKNTLQYRLKRLWQALGIDDQPDFEKEYFVRLLYIRRARQPGFSPAIDGIQPDAPSNPATRRQP